MAAFTSFSVFGKHVISIGTTREKLGRGTPNWATRGTGAYATNCHATGKQLAVAQVDVCHG